MHIQKSHGEQKVVGHRRGPRESESGAVKGGPASSVCSDLTTLSLSTAGISQMRVRGSASSGAQEAFPSLPFPPALLLKEVNVLTPCIWRSQIPHPISMSQLGTGLAKPRSQHWLRAQGPLLGCPELWGLWKAGPCPRSASARSSS